MPAPKATDEKPVLVGPTPNLDPPEPREPTDAEIADFLKRRAMNMTDEEVEEANIAHQRRLVLEDMEARRKAKAGLTPRPKEQLVVIKLTHDYWPSPQQVVDNPQVPSELAIVPPPQVDRVGVEIIPEARFKAGATLYLDMDTALMLLSERKAERADPLRTVMGNA